ncbi:MAG: DUF2341 domain-containing protein [Thermoplasmatales archaeon]|nr:MAG: DUF2341 domain-containing protein [Thermoplasmatales archaeon]
MFKKNYKCRENDAVSEVFSVILLIAVAITAFVALHSIIVSDSGPETQQTIILSGNLEGNTFTVEHSRGPSLSLNTKCIITIGGTPYNYYVRDLLSPQSKEDNQWSIGERIVCQLENISFFKVSFSIVDNINNYLVFDQIIQDGVISEYPYLIFTQNSTDVQSGSAKLWLVYNLRNYSGFVRFQYKKLGSSWINTSWIPKSGYGFHNETISGLNSSEIYLYRAVLSCESNIIYGEEKALLQNAITSVNTIMPYNHSNSPISVTVSGPSFLDKVSLWYKYSSDNISSLKNWWHKSWKYRKLITIDSSKVAADLTNFPMLVYESSDSDLASNAQNDGEDIVFILYSDNNTKLNHEIQSFNSSTGKLISWIKIPNLNSSGNTKIFMYYGNPTISNQENVIGTWDSEYEIVWHLQEEGDGTTDEYKDSTVNGNHGTGGKDDDSFGLGDLSETPDRVNGKFGYAQDFNDDGATGDRISSQNLSSAWNAVTGSVWIYGNNAVDDRIWGKSWGTAPDDNSILMRCIGTGGNTLGCRFRTDTSYTPGYQPASIMNNQWIYMVLTWDGSDDDIVRIYKNGVLQGSGLLVTGNSLYPNPPHEFFTLGNVGDGANNRCFDGYIQEARMSSVARSAEWISTEYNNQNSPSTFYVLGNQQEYSGDWSEWSNVNNPDISYPWSYNFDFPDGIGYYEFYSIGTYNGFDEVIPLTADALCYYERGTEVDPIIPFNQTSSSSTITATGDSSFDSVVLYYRFSNDNSSWELGSGDLTWSSELLINSGFETGDTTGWSNGGGGTMTVGTDCPWGTESPYEGTYYSYWLETGSNVNAHAYQNVDLGSYSSYIDVGQAKINVTGWLVSDEYNVPVYDEFFMNVYFYDASDALMSGYEYELGGTNPISQGSGNNVDNWAQYGLINYTIPAGARKVQIRYYTWEYDGSTWWQAGSADSFSVKVGIPSGTSDWTEFGTDSSYPWEWNFNYPDGPGYYGFYSIGTKAGFPDEQKPLIADSICYKE